MDEYHFVDAIGSSLITTLQYLTKNQNIFVKEVHITAGKTVIKYEMITEYGIRVKEKFLLNDITK